MDQTWKDGKGIDDYLVLQSNPDTALHELETQAKDLIEFMQPGHRHEIIRALKLVENEIEREMLVKSIAKKIGVPVSALRKEVAPQKTDDPKNGKPIVFEDPEPWPDPVDGASLLDDIVFWILRYVVLPIGAAEATAAWVIATWLRDELYHAPILAVLSPTKGCGKTTFLDLLRSIVFRGLLTSGPGIRLAVFFRLNDKYHPTMLIDEAEKLAGDDSSRELIGMINNGYRRGGIVYRSAPDTHEPEAFDAFGFRILAAIGVLFDTILHRAIKIIMDRRDLQAKIERFQSRVVETEGRILARQIARWVKDNRAEIAESESKSPRPEWLPDRACDNWAPLFAIGMNAGNGWLDKLLDSARRLSADTEESDKGERLLRDIKQIFLEAQNPATLESSVIVDALNKLESSPWGDMRKGKGITTIKLASMLKPFQIVPDQYRIADGKVRGYKFESFKDVFNRYIPPFKSVHGTNGASIEVGAISSRYSVPSQKPSKPLSDNECTDVPSQNGETGENEGTSFNFGENADNGAKTLAHMTSNELQEAITFAFGPGTRIITETRK